jgi:HEAT repeat protein
MTRILLSMLVVGCSALVGCGSGVPRDFQVSGKPIEHWLTAIHDADPKLRLKAVRALGNVGPHHPQAIPALTEALADADGNVRAQASLALLKSGPRAKSAVPALQAASQDSDPSVRKCAADALKKIGV